MIVSTKCWEGDWQTTLERIKTHPGYRYGDELWLVVNNMKTDISKQAKELVDKFIVAEDYMDKAEAAFNTHFESGREYSISELVEIYLADDLLCHYASDVIPPEENWFPEAIPLLKDYVAVSPAWEGQPANMVTDTLYFSDQCYLIDPKNFKQDIYNHQHEIGAKYPKHGGNNFEKRIGMYMHAFNKPKAVMQQYVYRHIPKGEK